VLIEEFDQLSYFARIGFGRNREMSGHQKSGELRGADSFERAAKSVGATHRSIVSLFTSGKFQRQKKTRVRAKSVNALAQVVAVRVQENVTFSLHEIAYDAADFWMGERFGAGKPDNGSGCIRRKCSYGFARL